MTSLWTRFDRKAGYYQLLQTVWFVALKPCNLFNHHLNLKAINKFSFQHCNLMDSVSIFRNSFLGVKISNATSPIFLKLTSHKNRIIRTLNCAWLALCNLLPFVNISKIDIYHLSKVSCRETSTLLYVVTL